ncbi:cystathionine gamma-synthase [Cryptococcus wingfieldii CBS 7118]|uniref:cystathionine gamma-synthase n=1 Tax=Cryptococcus wingfieldii CBS 7118 TaxID=1295528 RepID=A0A1E3J988_9TREE|nr:cystathionine gamma-synthase [Cryptococcus wingfieldii CBS 7118]ODN97438.1 cystathionine gamma-synthase [Cryptococcus wingfieldii CBS 7118]
MPHTVQPSGGPIPLGSSVPALTAHAISVSLPTWEDNVGYEEGDKRVVDKMETGYPRFFIHRSIQKLAALCLAKFGQPNELCILLPTPKVAGEGRDFLAKRTPSVQSRAVEFVICPSANSLIDPSAAKSLGVDCIELQILLFSKEHWPFAKAFWQHTGDGITSRCAEKALAFLGETPAGVEPRTASPPALERPASKAPSTRNRHYSRRTTSVPPTPTTPNDSANNTPSSSIILDKPSANPVPVSEENLTPDLTTYLEERYGRNLPLFNAPLAKQALKRRIAGGLLPSDEGYGEIDDVARGAGSGERGVTEEDVYLYPCGMSAIWHAHDISRVARRARGEVEGKSVCYGFPYTDTLKILDKWGPGCHFLGIGGAEEVEALEELLIASEKNPDEGQILALFCEFPSNPLLKSPDLVRIRKLADKYGFVIVVDETIGNFVNVEVVTFADIVVSSLTKIFSGDSNVMGGSLILNPNGPLYADLKAAQDSTYEDHYFPEDAVYMERNSRDYRARIEKVNNNAYDVCDLLYRRSLDDTTSPAEGKIIKKVYYPRYITSDTYAAAQRKQTLGKGGYGGLFSLTFTSLAASQAFFDTLECAKGPSLGTSFTLASPYTILAHYLELDWAAQYGVEKGLVRISVGQEDKAVLKGWFESALAAAETAERTAKANGINE